MSGWFTQIKKLIPVRSKPHLGTVIEPNIFERSKKSLRRLRSFDYSFRSNDITS